MLKIPTEEEIAEHTDDSAREAANGILALYPELKPEAARMCVDLWTKLDKDLDALTRRSFEIAQMGMDQPTYSVFLAGAAQTIAAEGVMGMAAQLNISSGRPIVLAEARQMLLPLVLSIFDRAARQAEACMHASLTADNEG